MGVGYPATINIAQIMCLCIVGGCECGDHAERCGTERKLEFFG